MEDEARYASVSRWLSPDLARLLDFGCARLVNAVKASLSPDKKMSFMCYLIIGTATSVWLFLFLGFLPRHGDLMEDEARYASVSRWLSPDLARLLDFGCAKSVKRLRSFTKY